MTGSIVLLHFELLALRLGYLPAVLPFCLQSQGATLRDVLGMKPLVLGVLEQLWLAYLPLTEVLEESFTR